VRPLRGAARARATVGKMFANISKPQVPCSEQKDPEVQFVLLKI